MTEDDDALVILVIGDGSIEGALPDPGPAGFAVEPLYRGSVSIQEEEGVLWIEGDAAAVRGSPPRGGRGHLRVVPRDSDPACWLVAAWWQAQGEAGGNVERSQAARTFALPRSLPQAQHLAVHKIWWSGLPTSSVCRDGRLP